MIARLKFLVGFFRAYRQARKAGADADDAKLIAARSMMDAQLGTGHRGGHGGGGPAEIAPDVAALWRDPEAAFDGTEGAWFGQGPFAITAAHLTLLRQMRFSWDGAERGAPMLDPERPYGRADVMAQLSDVFAGDDTAALAQRHIDMLFVLARALKHAILQPGRYGLRNLSTDDAREIMRGYNRPQGLSDDDLGLDRDGLVPVTDAHLKLLRGLEIRWPSAWDCEERLEDGLYPAAAADSKRPYGDYTFIEVDMARHLGVLPPPPGDGTPAVFEPEPALAARLQRLHWQMLGAMQAFVENAEITTGVYDLIGADESASG